MRKIAAVFIMVIIILFSLNIARAEIVINMQAIKAIESNGNPYAFNLRTKCYGLYQISEICLKDYNQIHRTDYAPQDLFNPFINETVASWYFKEVNRMLNFYEIPVSITTVIASYNWGIGNVVKWYKNGASFKELPQETQEYIKKYQKIIAG